MARPDAKTMKTLVSKGQAMPAAPGSGRSGRFPIRNSSDLDKAIRAVGRVQPATDQARASVRRYIIKRAQALNLADQIPGSWNTDGTLKPGT